MVTVWGWKQQSWVQDSQQSFLLFSFLFFQDFWLDAPLFSTSLYHFPPFFIDSFLLSLSDQYYFAVCPKKNNNSKSKPNPLLFPFSFLLIFFFHPFFFLFPFLSTLFLQQFYMINIIQNNYTEITNRGHTLSH